MIYIFGKEAGMEEQAVAEVVTTDGEIYDCKDLVTALEEVGSSGTMTMQQDVVLPDGEQPCITTDNITLDLNGKIISGTGDSNYHYLPRINGTGVTICGNSTGEAARPFVCINIAAAP